MVGSVFAATAAWVLLGDDFADKRIVPGGTWRHYAAVAAIPAAITLISAAWFLPESPRFLLKAGGWISYSSNSLPFPLEA